MGKLITPLLAAGGLLTVLASPSYATLQLSANINGTVISCADQAACDTNLAVGALQIVNQTVNGVEILGSAQTQQVGASNFLNTSSFQIINHNLVAATVTVAVSGTDFVGPVDSYSATGSGSWQNADTSSINLTFYADTGNAQGADTPVDLPGVQLASMSDVANGSADSFSQSFNGAFVDPDLYSMSLGTTGTLAAWNGVANQELTLVGRSQAIVTVQAVPEPGSLAMLGGGLLALGVFSWFRRRRNDGHGNFAAA